MEGLSRSGEYKREYGSEIIAKPAIKEPNYNF